MSQASAEHHRHAQEHRAACAVLTVSDTRTEATDKGGRLIIDELKAAGHHISTYKIVTDDTPQIESQLRCWVGQHDLDVIFTTGGTGIARRDSTIEVVSRLIEKEIPGFGQLFRMLSFDQIGAAAMLSRAVAGLAQDCLIFALPGSTNAVALAMKRLILPELPHLVWERRK